MQKFLFLLIILFFACKDKSSNSDEQPNALEEIRAVDISFYPQIKASGYTYKTIEGFKFSFWDILKSRGVNAIRLRLWHDDFHLSSSPYKVYELAEEAKANGLKVILDFHYSATWADPGKQEPPPNWKGLGLEEVQDSIYQFTGYMLQLIKPEYVQLGNELNSGFIWPLGHINQAAQFLTLYRSALKAAREANPRPLVILHYAGLKDAPWFYGLFTSTDYDIAGISYYNYWHGNDLNALSSTISTLRQQTKKGVMVLETAYPFTLTWKDYTHNNVGDSSQLHPDYPATQDGQAQFLKEVNKRVKEAGGIGVCYWGGEWVAYKSDTSTSGSAWENQALWDFEGKAVKAGF